MLLKIKKIIHFLIAHFAYWFYGRPARKMIVIGVTGTKGKSSTCRFIASVLEASGEKVGMLTTVEFQIADFKELNTKKMTMLGRGQIQKMLKKMVQAGCKYAVIETSSEGILQYRHIGLDYDICVFTNLGKEHSERHGSFEKLRNDKAKIFLNLSKKKNKIINNKKIEKIIITNSDDKNAEYYSKYPVDKKFTYSINNDSANFQALIEKSDIKGTRFKLNNIYFEISILGAFNTYNVLPAIIIAQEFKIPNDLIYSAISSIKNIPGRMEFINKGQPFLVVVDYAHEALSLKEAFTSLRQLIKPGNKLIGVVGSDGGGRDKSKRYEIGEIAAKLCDIVMVTGVDYFDEDPKEISEMVAKGARSIGKKDGIDLFIEVDRTKAFEKSLKLLNSGDVIIFTAKGAESCMAVANNKKIPWNDRLVAEKLLNDLGYTT